MYVPEHFDQPRIEILHELMRARPLATLVTPAPGGFEADHLPLRLLGEPQPLGTLRGHVARANPMWRRCAGADVLAIFQGPDAYISPSWYATKKETGKAVPTWNYAVAHVRGRLRVLDDPAWLRAELEALTGEHEAGFANPWRVADAPADYIAALATGVIGIEIAIETVVGKWKLSQNQPARNRRGVADGLRAGRDARAAEMSMWIERDAQGD